MLKKSFRPKKSQAVTLLIISASLFAIPVILMASATSGEDASGPAAAFIMWPIALILGLIGLLRFIKSIETPREEITQNRKFSPKEMEEFKKSVVVK